MPDLLHLLLRGLSLGCVYAVASMGFVILYKTTRVLNFAYGQLMAAGSVIFILLSSLTGLPISAVFAFGIFISIALAWIVGRLLISRMNSGDKTLSILMTLGVALILKGFLSITSRSVALTGELTQAVSSVDVIILMACIIVILAFFLLFQKSSWGLYIRALSDNRPASLSLGIPIERLSILSWVIAGAAAGATGILITISSGLKLRNLDSMESIIFAVIILGGVASIRGAILGGLVIGLMEALEQGHAASSLTAIGPYLLVLLILVIKPYGLLTKKEKTGKVGQ
jgi:branched-chain amino acid transport system permease protein